MSDKITTSSSNSSRENSPTPIVINDISTSDNEQVQLENEQFNARTKTEYYKQKHHYNQLTATCMTFLYRKMAQETKKFIEFMQTKTNIEDKKKFFYRKIRRNTKIIKEINCFNEEMDEVETYIIPVLTEIYNP